VTAFSEWLELMLAEIARKREEAQREREERALRDAERKAREADGPPATRR
jgi:hypothetical protein